MYFYLECSVDEPEIFSCDRKWFSIAIDFEVSIEKDFLLLGFPAVGLAAFEVVDFKVSSRGHAHEKVLHDEVVADTILFSDFEHAENLDKEAWLAFVGKPPHVLEVLHGELLEHAELAAGEELLHDEEIVG